MTLYKTISGYQFYKRFWHEESSLKKSLIQPDWVILTVCTDGPMLFGLVPEILRQALRDLPSHPRLWQQLGHPRFAFSGSPEDGPKQKMIQFHLRKSCFSTLDLEYIIPRFPPFHTKISLGFPYLKKSSISASKRSTHRSDTEIGMRKPMWRQLLRRTEQSLPSAGIGRMPFWKRWQLTTCCWFESIQVQFCWKITFSHLLFKIWRSKFHFVEKSHFPILFFQRISSPWISRRIWPLRWVWWEISRCRFSQAKKPLGVEDLG